MLSKREADSVIDQILSEDLTLSHGTSKAIFRALVKLGVDTEHLLNASNLTIQQLNHDHPTKHIQLWQAADKLTGSPDIGLQVGTRSDPHYRGILGHVFLKSKNLHDALKLVIKHYEILVTYMEMALSTDTRNAYITFSYSQGNFHRYGIDHMVAAFINWVNVFLKRSLPITKITYQFDLPPCTKIYQKTFGCKVEFEQAENKITFPIHCLKMLNPEYNAYLHDVLLKHAEITLKDISAEAGFIDKATRAISKGLRQGTFSAEHVSTSLNMSKRTYQRKLKEKNQNHQILLDKIRHDSAITYLKQSSHELKRLPFILGYADSRGFYRAFRRWEGCAPKEYIRNL